MEHSSSSHTHTHTYNIQHTHIILHKYMTSTYKSCTTLFACLRFIVTWVLYQRIKSHFLIYRIMFTFTTLSFSYENTLLPMIQAFAIVKVLQLHREFSFYIHMMCVFKQYQSGKW